MKILQRYLITDPFYYSDTPIYFKKVLLNAIKKHSPDYICFRDKQTPHIQELATITCQLAQEFNINSVIHTHITHLKPDFIHIDSTYLHTLSRLTQPTIASCHTLEDIHHAIELQCHAITLSPLFATPLKGEPLGIERFNELSQDCSLPLFALGGITTPEHVQQCYQTHATGFASIRYFLS